MPQRARRPASRLWLRPARRALLALCLWQPGAAAHAETVIAARYDAPTARYAHGVLGDALEYGALTLTLNTGTERRFTLDEALVFEDTVPRLSDLDGDGQPEVIVVESHRSFGARLAVFGPNGRIAATPHIGTRFRWLAPLGSADLDGDGLIELAYVDRPHLDRILRIWRFQAGVLTEIASRAGVTNHRIGESDIAGGIRNCGGVAEMIVADASWQWLLALRYDGREITSRRIGDDTGRASFAAAMACR